MNKIQQLLKVSDPDIVYEKAKEIYGDNVIIGISTQKNKKYMILNPYTNKYIHFGYLPMQDFTYHQDEERRRRFLIRNKRWAQSPLYSSSFMSYHLLW